jgi:CBS domain-containing protein
MTARPSGVTEDTTAGRAARLMEEHKVRRLPVLRDGRVTGVDEAAMLREARTAARAVLTRHDEAFAVGEQLLGAVRSGWRQSMATEMASLATPARA